VKAAQKDMPASVETEARPPAQAAEPVFMARKRRRPWLGWSLAAAGLGLLGYAIYSRVSTIPEVTVAQAQVAELWASFTAEGVVRGMDFQVAAEAGGRIAQLDVREGARVRKGQPLVRLETGQLDAAVQEAEAAAEAALGAVSQAASEAALASRRVYAGIEAARSRLRQAELAHAELASGSRPEQVEQARQRVARATAALQEAERAFTRAEYLFREGAIPRASYERAEAALKAATADLREAEAAERLLRAGPSTQQLALSQAGIEAARADLRRAESESRQIQVANAGVSTARSRLSQARATLARARDARSRQLVLSPADGEVTKLFVEAGAVTLPGVPILTIASRSDLRIEAEISSEDASKVRPGMEVVVTSPAYPGREFRAKVRSMLASGEIKPDSAIRTRIVRARVDLLEESQLFRPGMEVDVEGLRLLKTALAVPTDALTFAGTEPKVLLVREGRIEEAPVRIGIQNPDLTEIVSGLNPGDVVVVRGKDAVAPGQRVRERSP
jgi:HlyD family secretion protein